VTLSTLTVHAAVAPAACAVAVAEAVAVAWVVACVAEEELVPVVAGLLVEPLEPPEEHPAASRPTLKRQADAATGLRNCMKCLLGVGR
jgi:hypothetical protein